MTPTNGDIWLADLGAETRRSVFVISDERFHRLAERAIVAPVLASPATGHHPPWWIAHENSIVAVERLASVPVERLLERQGAAQHDTVRAVQRTAGRLIGRDR